MRLESAEVALLAATGVLPDAEWEEQERGEKKRRAHARWAAAAAGTRLVSASSAPDSPSPGDLWLDRSGSASGELRVWTGEKWVQMTSAEPAPAPSLPGLREGGTAP